MDKKQTSTLAVLSQGFAALILLLLLLSDFFYLTKGNIVISLLFSVLITAIIYFIAVYWLPKAKYDTKIISCRTEALGKVTIGFLSFIIIFFIAHFLYIEFVIKPKAKNWIQNRKEFFVKAQETYYNILNNHITVLEEFYQNHKDDTAYMKKTFFKGSADFPVFMQSLQYEPKYKKIDFKIDQARINASYIENWSLINKKNVIPAISFFNEAPDNLIETIKNKLKEKELEFNGYVLEDDDTLYFALRANDVVPKLIKIKEEYAKDRFFNNFSLFGVYKSKYANSIIFFILAIIIMIIIVSLFLVEYFQTPARGWKWNWCLFVNKGHKNTNETTEDKINGDLSDLFK